ncbi:MAG: hypothetical protein JWN86_2578 [Planctomycetota bacterium]|nr:hypothetical protein [Planctomycetota bacterium]
MTAWKWLVAGIVLTSTARAQVADTPKAEEPAKEPEIAAQAPAPAVEDMPAPKPATSKIAAVTLYQGNALVTREVAVPEGKGLVELVVTPLPARTLDGSLYTEAPDGFRVLSTRYRTRAVKEDTRKEVRAKEEQIKSLQAEGKKIKGELRVLEQNLEFVLKLESFTGVTMRSLAEKGAFDSEKIIDLSKYVMEARGEKSASKVELEQKTLSNLEAMEFAKRQLAELSAGSSRTEIDAVIVVDKSHAPAGSVRLNYLVGDATWAPRYRLRAGGPKDPVRLEYLAAIEQRSGEDWTDAELTLSTAQPSFGATLPDLLPLNVSVSKHPGEEGNKASLEVGGMDRSAAIQNRAQAQEFRGQAGQALIGNYTKAGGDLLNQAAALDQAEELLAKDDDKEKSPGSSAGPSVTYHLKGSRTIPSRRDAQVVEIARFEMAADYFAKAVPVLSPRVFRLARLTNTGDTVLLPGEATMYVGSDFVGRMALPQVAQGEPFTVGFGVDPQLQIGRRLVKKTRAVQGGNQVLTYEFRIVARNFGTTPVKLQVWDRLPKGEDENVAVNLQETKPEISADPLYLRIGKPEGLLRWDLDVPAGTIGDKALAVVYSFKLEYARELAIDYFKSGGLKEAPIGGMGGGMGGMGGGGGFRLMPLEK